MASESWDFERVQILYKSEILNFCIQLENGGNCLKSVWRLNIIRFENVYKLEQFSENYWQNRNNNHEKTSMNTNREHRISKCFNYTLSIQKKVLFWLYSILKFLNWKSSG